MMESKRPKKSRKTKILFLCQFSYPEYNSSATLPFDTAKYLADKGYAADIICGYPKEYATAQHVPYHEIVEGVQLHRLPYLQLKRTKTIGRLINYFSFTASAFLQLLKMYKYDVIICYSNPPVLPVVALMASKMFGTKLIFVSYDVYPEVAYASKALSPGCAIDIAMWKINHQLYSKASKVVVLTDEMRQFILQNRTEIDPSRVCVIPNWAHEGCQSITKKAYENFGYYEGQFVVSYFGNLGICQETETMLTAIRILKDDAKIQFLIAGHGTKLPEVKDATKGCPNVKIVDFLVGEDFEQALAISSCSIVSLEKGLIGTCAPSKYYSYLQAGCPVLSITEENSYLALEVEKEKIGYAIRIGDGAELVTAIRTLYSDSEKRKMMSQKAKVLYEERYAKHIAMQKYEKMISQILDER